MSRSGETLDESRPRDGAAESTPGVFVVHSGTAPTFHVVKLRRRVLHLGRALLDDLGLVDERVSRDHAVLGFEGDKWTVQDLGSRNGSSADGTPVRGDVQIAAPRVVRIGNTIVVPVDDVTPFEGARVTLEGESVIGPRLQAVHRAVASAAAAGARTLLITGETGTGKERASREFHAHGPASGGPLIAMDALGKAFDRAASLSPDASWTTWGQFAKQGSTAAAAKDAAGVKAACKACHDAHKDNYKTKFRARPVN